MAPFFGTGEGDVLLVETPPDVIFCRLKRAEQLMPPTHRTLPKGSPSFVPILLLLVGRTRGPSAPLKKGQAMDQPDVPRGLGNPASWKGSPLPSFLLSLSLSLHRGALQRIPPLFSFDRLCFHRFWGKKEALSLPPPLGGEATGDQPGSAHAPGVPELQRSTPSPPKRSACRGHLLERIVGTPRALRGAATFAESWGCFVAA